MTTTIPTVAPSEIVAGDLVQFKRGFTDYPATAWTASFILPGLGTLTAVASGSDFLFTAQAATTAGWTEGTYRWWLRVDDGASPNDVRTVEQGVLKVIADPSAAASQSGELADVVTAITNLEAVINGRASQDQRRYRIGDRELERLPISELMQLLAYYRGRRRQLEASLGMPGASGRVLVRFGRVR